MPNIISQDNLTDFLTQGQRPNVYPCASFICDKYSCWRLRVNTWTEL